VPPDVTPLLAAAPKLDFVPMRVAGRLRTGGQVPGSRSRHRPHDLGCEWFIGSNAVCHRAQGMNWRMQG
jgi:hypothetical protein